MELGRRGPLGDIEPAAALSPGLGAVGTFILRSDDTPVFVGVAGDVDAVAAIGDATEGEELEGNPPVLMD